MTSRYTVSDGEGGTMLRCINCKRSYEFDPARANFAFCGRPCRDVYLVPQHIHGLLDGHPVSRRAAPLPTRRYALA